MLLFLKKQRFGSLAQWSANDLCQSFDEPGIGTADPALVDYSQIPATADQAQIEAALSALARPISRLLHVGVGDSGLAARLHGSCKAIDGITVSNEELRHANSLNVPNYQVCLVNKYTRNFVQCLQPGYDVIVDNNPASFACCGYHFAAMFENYRWALVPGGELITHQRGMRWVAGDRRWRMNFDDLKVVGQRFGLVARKLTDAVYSLRRV